MIDLLMTEVGRHLPYLRRHACALTRSRSLGDACVQACLETILAGEAAGLGASGNIRRDLYRLLSIAVDAVADGVEADGPRDAGDAAAPQTLMDDRIARLDRDERRVLLLHLLDGFGLEDVSFILGQDLARTAWLLDRARLALMRQRPTAVMIIEDEPPVADTLAELMRQAGHSVVGVAGTAEDALALCLRSQPGLLLADMRLGGDAAAGVEAVKRIRRRMQLPVVFIAPRRETVRPERWSGPAFMVSRPFDRTLVLTTVSKALLAAAQP